MRTSYIITYIPFSPELNMQKFYDIHGERKNTLFNEIFLFHLIKDKNIKCYLAKT